MLVVHSENTQGSKWNVLPGFGGRTGGGSSCREGRGFRVQFQRSIHACVTIHTHSIYKIKQHFSSNV